MSISEERDLLAQGMLKGWQDAADWLEEYSGQPGKILADTMRNRFTPKERPEVPSAPIWALLDALKAEYGGEDGDWTALRSLDRIEAAIYRHYIRPHERSLARRFERWVMKNEIEPKPDWEALGHLIQSYLDGFSAEAPMVPRDHIIQSMAYVDGWISDKFPEAASYVREHMDEMADAMIEDS